MKDAPLLRDARALCGVLLQDLESVRGYAALRERLARTALDLLDEAGLAVGGFEPPAALERADAALRCLRGQLLLAHEVGLLDAEPYLDYAEQANRVGRQIGGFLKKLAA